MSRRGRLAMAFAIVFTGAVLLHLAPLRAGPPGEINFQARLTDAQGKPLPDGRVARVTFKIFSDAGVSTFAWGEAHTDVPISRGVVTVRLGAGAERVSADDSTTPGANPLPVGIFDGGTKYLQIRVNGDPPLAPAIPLVSVPYALSAGSLNGKTETELAVQAVPVGTIVDWYRPGPSTPVPTSWKVCDGSTVTDAASPLNGQAVPNLVGRFTRGIGLADATGATGGADSQLVTLSHNHSVPGHTHSIPDHSHAFSGQTGTPIGVTVPIQGVFQFTLANIDHVHNFSGTTNLGGPGQTGSGGNVNTDTVNQSVTVNTVPAYVGVLKIIRIK